MAARAGHTEVAKYLLQNKAKVNAKAKVRPGGGKGPGTQAMQLHAENLPSLEAWPQCWWHGDSMSFLRPPH